MRNFNYYEEKAIKTLDYASRVCSVILIFGVLALVVSAFVR